MPAISAAPCHTGRAAQWRSVVARTTSSPAASDNATAVTWTRSIGSAGGTALALPKPIPHPAVGPAQLGVMST